MEYDKPKIVLYDLFGYTSVNSKEIDINVINEVNSIKDKLEKKGFEIIPIATRWPRDRYVHDGNVLIPQFIYGKIGEGGLIVQGNDFVLISSKLKECSSFNNVDNIKKRFFKHKNIYFIEPMKIDGRYINENMHIDLTIGSIPSINLITIDHDHYKQQKSLFNKISKENDTLVVPINIKKSQKRLLFNNYLVIENNSAYVLTDPSANSLNSILEQFDIDLQHVDESMIGNSKIGGSIRCLTNIVKNEETENFVYDYNKAIKKYMSMQVFGLKPNIKLLIDLIQKENK